MPPRAAEGPVFAGGYAEASPTRYHPKSQNLLILVPSMPIREAARDIGEFEVS